VLAAVVSTSSVVLPIVPPTPRPLPTCAASAPATVGMATNLRAWGCTAVEVLGVRVHASRVHGFGTACGPGSSLDVGLGPGFDSPLRRPCSTMRLQARAACPLQSARADGRHARAESPGFAVSTFACGRGCQCGRNAGVTWVCDGQARGRTADTVFICKSRVRVHQTGLPHGSHSNSGAGVESGIS